MAEQVVVSRLPMHHPPVRLMMSEGFLAVTWCCCYNTPLEVSSSFV